MNQRVYQLFYRHFIGRCNHSKSEIILFTLLTKLENQTTQLCISYCKAHSKFLNFVFFIVNLRKMYDIKVSFIFEFPFCLNKYMTYIYVMSLKLKLVIYVGRVWIREFNPVNDVHVGFPAAKSCLALENHINKSISSPHVSWILLFLIFKM